MATRVGLLDADSDVSDDDDTPVGVALHQMERPRDVWRVYEKGTGVLITRLSAPVASVSSSMFFDWRSMASS